MSNTIILKQSSVTNKVPNPSDLVLGELAINTTDGIIYLKDVSNNIITIQKQQTKEQIKISYESNVNTNAFTDADKNKLAVIDPSSGFTYATSQLYN